MPANEIIITPEGTIRTPSASSDSMHEFKVEKDRMLYRWIAPDGSALPGDRSDWMTLSADQVRQHYSNASSRVRRWFEEQGFTQDRVEREANEEKASQKRRR
jgi:hypothetical protein